jgi:hypothetical protein
MADKIQQWDMTPPKGNNVPIATQTPYDESLSRNIELSPANHIIGRFNETATYKMPGFDKDVIPEKVKLDFMMDPSDHYIQDPDPAKTFVPQPEDGHEIYVSAIRTTEDGEKYRTFSGSATVYNPENDPYKEQVAVAGFGEVESVQSKKDNDNLVADPPTSPFHPFTRMEPLIARETTLLAYNRTHIPVADNEFRKAFRHIFITRPECYITCVEGGLSLQAKNDEDFASCYSRMPYILEILSPRYVGGGEINTGADGLNSNINFLLSNRVTGMQTNTIEMSTLTTLTKTQYGQQITIPSLMQSEMNGKLQLTFTDTKNMEVSEMIRMWMLYMTKRHIGVFAPPYNGYSFNNNFNGSTAISNLGTNPKSNVYNIKNFTNLHPYDRAVEYPCTIFDVITNESDTKILYFCEYIGVFPTQLSRTLNTQAGGPITKLDVSVNFEYQAKIENNTKSLVHFNYNAGITDEMGRLKSGLKESIPFLLRHESDERSDMLNKQLGNYIGPAGMFTGSPYVVIGNSGTGPIPGSKQLYVPYLKFAPIVRNNDINYAANLGIVNHAEQTTGTPVNLQ